MTDQTWANLSEQAVGAAVVMYFVALLAHLVQWKAVRSGDDPDRASAAERAGYLITIIAVGVNFAAVLARGIAAHRVPWGNMYEFSIAGAFVVGFGYVVLRPRLKLAWMGPLVLVFNFAVLLVGRFVLFTPITNLSDALNSYWLVIHVSALMIATGAFTLGGMASIIYLVKNRTPDVETGWLSRVPSLAVLDRTSYRIHAVAFVIWTFGALIAGPIWAHEAWGSYWNWDPKEVWAFITWVVYAGYLHARATVGWRGRNAAVLACVGLATLWFNFIGINYFSSGSQHSYAKPQASEVTAP